MSLLDKIKDNVKNPEKNTNINTNVGQVGRFFSVEEFKVKLINELENNYKNNKPRDYVRASEAGACANQLVFRLLNKPVNFNIVSKGYYLPLMAHVGNAIHDYIQKHGDFSKIEYPVNSTKYRIHARIDALINDCVIVEIKSVGDARVVREKDIYQVVANFLVLEDAGFHIEGGQLIYISRTLTQYETFEITRQELVEKSAYLIDKLNEVFRCVKEDIQCDKFLNKAECYYCEYNNVCKHFKNKKKEK